jgi:uncharacterized membrane protein
MITLIFILSLIVTPLLSVALGILLFSGLPIAVGVGLTILTFLLLFFGCQYFASMWLVNIHAPAKAIEYKATLLSPSSDKYDSTALSPSADKYESTFLSPSPDTSGMTKLDIPYVFALGVFGHIICGIGIIVEISTASRGEPTVIIV